MQPQTKTYSNHSNSLKFKFDTGKYVFKKWRLDKYGNRIAVKCKKSANPDLQSTYITNTDQSIVLRFIRLDLDYEKSSEEFKFDNKLNWTIIQKRIEQYPKIFEGIEYVTKSTSGRGLHLLFGISPLPIDDRTQSAQIIARKLQYQLVQIFTELGIGADLGGLGLKQDFCTFNKKNNLVYHNQVLTKRIENEAKKRSVEGLEVTIKKEPFITNLLKYVENVTEELEINYRLYPDSRVEKSFSKLFLYLMGLYVPKQIDASAFLKGEKKFVNLKVPYVPANSMIELSKSDLARIMQVDLRTANKYFKFERFHTLFHFEETIDQTIKIGCKFNKKVLKQIDRAQKVIAFRGFQTKIKLRILDPINVKDGERNLAVVNWAIAYKWNGYSENDAFEKIKIRAMLIPDRESSRSCKENHIKNTVRSIYANRKELFGICKVILPGWMEDDKYFLKYAKRLKEQKNQKRKNNIITQSNSNFTKFCSTLRPFISSRSFTPGGLGSSSLYQFCSETRLHVSVPVRELKFKYILDGLTYKKILFQHTHENNKIYNIKPFYILRRDGFLCLKNLNGNQIKYYSAGIDNAKKKVKVLISDNLIYIIEFGSNVILATHKLILKKNIKFSILNEHELNSKKIFYLNENFILKAYEISKELSWYLQNYFLRIKGFSDTKFAFAMISLKNRFKLSRKSLDDLFKYCLENNIFSYRIIIDLALKFKLNSEKVDEHYQQY